MGGGRRSRRRRRHAYALRTTRYGGAVALSGVTTGAKLGPRCSRSSCAAWACWASSSSTRTVELRRDGGSAWRRTGAHRPRGHDRAGGRLNGIGPCSRRLLGESVGASVVTLSTVPKGPDHPHERDITRLLDNYVAGAWAPASPAEQLDVTNPATGRSWPACRSPRRPTSTRRSPPPARRCRVARGQRHRPRADPVRAARGHGGARRPAPARSPPEMGKTIADARAEVARTIEMVEAACAVPTTIQGRIARGRRAHVDAETVRQPVGVCAAIAPFNFPAMVPFWFCRSRSPAATRSCSSRPSRCRSRSRSPSRSSTARACPTASSTSSTAAARSSRASSSTRASTRSRSSARRPVAKLVYERAAKAGKRVQALGGRQEPHGRDARRRRSTRPSTGIDRLGLRRRRAALHGGLGRRHRRRRARAADGAARAGHRSAARRRRPPGRRSTSARSFGDGARPHPRVDRPRRGRRRELVVDGRDAAAASCPTAAPTSARRSSTTSPPTWTSAGRRSSARCSGHRASDRSTRRSRS